MLKASINNWTSVAGTNVPFATVFNTNNKIANNNGVVSLLKPALWEIGGALTLTSATTGDYTVNILADGVTNASYTATIATASDFVTIPLSDAIRTIAAQYPNVADISVQVSAGATVSGNLLVKYVN